MAYNGSTNEFGYVRGNLAFAPEFKVREHEETVPRRREQQQKPVRKTETRTHKAQRTAISISPVDTVLLAILGVMALFMLFNFARLTTLSSEVSALNSEAAALKEEQIKLKTEYEKSFDLASVKEAAEAAGMSKPSASQIYYIDMSGKDSVTVYQEEEGNMLSRIFTSLGHGVVSAVEYFK